ncbi:flagellin N-terminal helical domain-containing protein [Craterilacuibacter sinensis]|uniref:Flagellin n=1 Tax=Craterilacuibacter sinensis TaxID=2686017 RepID=A0A845BHX3_9NEIS|nr:flagellin [Craterilacuibacter sinensis]MXR35799.1 Lateral flagellin [Craterilacuibacter sinensis]
MLSLHTNAASLFTKSNLNANQSGLSTSMTRLGTGLRINSAMDDAAGLQIATRLDAQSRGMSVAMRNTQNATSMMQTAEGALNEVSNITLRMKDLATQAADGASSAADRTAMETEFNALALEVDNIVGNTKFGGEKLLDAAAGFGKGAVTFQIGADGAEKYAFDVSTKLGTMKTATDALKGGDLDAAANAAIGLADTALKAISDVRSDLGAGANRLQHVYNNLANVNNNTLMAKGRIMDTDYASESASMTSKQMLMQAGTSMLKQSGSMSQLAMSLLQ